MILNKKDLKLYLEYDEKARFGKKVSYVQKMKCGKLWKFNVLLRKTEYYYNNNHGIKRILYYFYKWRYNKVCEKLGYSVPLNVFDYGLCIVHAGTVVINNKVTVGKFCRMHVCTNIGANGGDLCPRLGDHIYIAPGAKIFGDVELASGIAIGANAVVNKSFLEENITIAGMPAKKISNMGSKKLICK